MLLTLRLLCTVLAALVLASTAIFRTTLTLQIRCLRDWQRSLNTTVTFSYAEGVSYAPLVAPVCRYPALLRRPPSPQLVDFRVDYVVAKRWIPTCFLSAGVLVFAYCVSLFWASVLCRRRFEQPSTLYTLADFVVSVVFALLWLCVTIAETSYVILIQPFAAFEYYAKLIPDCNGSLLGARGEVVAVCSAVDNANLTGVQLGLFFGYGCILVWSGTCWFIYKDNLAWRVQIETLPGAVAL